MKEFSSSLNYIANLDFFSNLPEFYNEFCKVDDDLKDLSEDKSQIEKDWSTNFGWRDVKEGSFWILIVVVLLIIIFVIVIKLRKRRNAIYVRPKNNNHSFDVQENMEMTDYD